MYEYNHNIQINPDILSEAVSNYCEAEGDYRTYAVALAKRRHTAEWWGATEAQRAEQNGTYWQKSRASDEAWTALRLTCRVVGLDPSAVLPVFKSIRRNCQYQNGWEREAHFSRNRYFEWESKKPGSVESLVDLCRA